MQCPQIPSKAIIASRMLSHTLTVIQTCPESEQAWVEVAPAALLLRPHEAAAWLANTLHRTDTGCVFMEQLRPPGRCMRKSESA